MKTLLFFVMSFFIPFTLAIEDGDSSRKRPSENNQGHNPKKPRKTEIEKLGTKPLQRRLFGGNFGQKPQPPEEGKKESPGNIKSKIANLSLNEGGIVLLPKTGIVLPREIWGQIFSFLPANDYGNVLLSCKGMQSCFYAFLSSSHYQGLQNNANKLFDTITPSQTNLSLIKSNLYKFPEKLWEANHLTTLDLSNNYLDWFPSTIGKLEHLKILNLSHNQIPHIPLSIGNLVKLEVLNLSNNLIEKTPLELGNLVSLLSLNLSNNNLKKIDLISDPERMKKWIEKNNIKKIIKEENLLSYIDLSNKAIIDNGPAIPLFNQVSPNKEKFVFENSCRITSIDLSNNPNLIHVSRWLFQNVVHGSLKTKDTLTTIVGGKNLILTASEADKDFITFDELENLKKNIGQGKGKSCFFFRPPLF